MYKLGSNTEIVCWSDIKHMDLYCVRDLWQQFGWDHSQISYFLGAPDFEVRRGKFNTGPRFWWRGGRVRQWTDRLFEKSIRN